MRYETGQQLVNDAEQLLYQAAGTAVQMYSQNILLRKLQQAFDFLFLEQWWPQFVVREQLTLAAGIPTAAPTDILHYEDIRYVYPEGSRTPLPKLPLGINTLLPQLQTGGHPRYIEYNASTLFRCWPADASGDVLVVGRRRPAKYLITDVFEMDSELLTTYAVWSYFTDDASNPEAAAKSKALFDSRYKTLRDNSFNEPIVLDGGVGMFPLTWTERPFP
jgi:hypothetical protein